MTKKKDVLKWDKPIRVGKQLCRRYGPKTSVKDSVNGRTVKNSHEYVLTGKH